MFIVFTAAIVSNLPPRAAPEDESGCILPAWKSATPVVGAMRVALSYVRIGVAKGAIEALLVAPTRNSY
ncbi:hypothetical protein [Melaminivora alkalimesophila]|nr:hypothetical protein [Melaminivora alkalimesophila]